MNISKLTTTALIAGLVLASCGQKEPQSGILVDDTKYQTITLEDMASELEVFKIRTDPSLLTGECEDMQVHDDYIFLSDYERVYCIENDSVIGVLDKRGRGHGEYTDIGRWGYLPEKNVLYVWNNKSMLYYSVPDFQFIRKEDSELIPEAFYGDESFFIDNDMADSLATIHFWLSKRSNTTGQKTRLMPISYLSNGFLDGNQQITVSDDGIYFSVCGRNNKLMLYDGSGLREVASVRYDDKFAIPEKIDRYEGLNLDLSVSNGTLAEEMNKLTEYNAYFHNEDENAKRAFGCFCPTFADESWSFWHFHHESQLYATFYTIVNGTEACNYLITIPGLAEMDEPATFAPCTMHDGYVYCLYQGNREMLTDPDTEPSPLASRILELAPDSNDDDALIVLRARMKL